MATKKSPNNSEKATKDSVKVEEFKRLLSQKGEELYRDMPWRDDTRPYYVLVSELMLQQTQVGRVVPKFEAFIEVFPNESSLAKADLMHVSTLWQGLGYNRRAKFLHEAAKMIVGEFGGKFPDKKEDLLKLPGVGKNTAGAMLAYAFNQPTVFIETNIRSVYIHHFIHDRFDVDDKEIAKYIEQTIDRDNPRRFYQSLMDYGTWLKASGVKNNRASKHYKKQSPLKGSLREMRGEILRKLTNNEGLRYIKDDPRFETAFASLERDGLIVNKDT